MSVLKEYVKSEKETEIVSKFRADYFKKYSTFLIRKGLINKNSIIVDVPCGTGGMSKEISKKINPKKFILMDINPEMIKASKKNLSSKNTFIVGDAGNIGNLIKEQVDTIICLNGFHQYIERKKDFLKGCSKILKKGGIFIFDISTRGLNDNYTKDFFKIQEKELARFVKKYNTKLSFPKWSDEKLLIRYEKMILKCGLNLLEKKEFITWKSIKDILEDSIKIPGRSRPWMKGLDYKKRRKAFVYAIRSTVDKIGKNKIENNRIFFIIKK